jgi:hypothetical protein
MKKCVLVLVLCMFTLAAAAAQESSDGGKALFQVKMLIDDDLEANLPLIREAALDLSESDRFYLYQSEEKGAALPFAVNLLVGIGIGSYIQGDTVGGTTALVGELGSVVLMYMGAGTMNEGLLYGGALSFLVFRIYELVRPFNYKSDYNRMLSSALDTRRAEATVMPEVRLSSDGTMQPGFMVSVKY